MPRATSSRFNRHLQEGTNSSSSASKQSDGQGPKGALNPIFKSVQNLLSSLSAPFQSRACSGSPS